jgi:hypothetical protein
MALYRHRLMGTYTGEEWSFGVYSSGSGSLAAAETAWANGVSDFFSVAYLADLATTVAATEISTVEINPSTGKQLTGVTDPRSDVGTATGSGCPNQCAPVVSFRTATLSRAGRGRIYAPSPAVSVLTDGRLTSTAAGHLADSAQAMLQALDTAGFTPVIYHRAAGTTTNITSIDVGDVIDTQRRRRNKLIEVRTSRTI